MSLIDDQSRPYNTRDLGFSPGLTRAFLELDTPPDMAHGITQQVTPNIIGKGNLLASLAGESVQYIDVGQHIVTVAPGDNIQAVINALSEAGGGTIKFVAGRYLITTALVGYANVFFLGENEYSTILDFNSTSANLSFAGTNIYSTGTITAISGVSVTGSGTSWLANVSAGQYLFLDTRHYLIASVTDNTHLVLSEGYADTVTLPLGYRIGTIITGVQISNMTLKNSTGTALTFTDARDLHIDSVLFLMNNIGLAFTNVSLLKIRTTISVSNTSHGATFTNVGLCPADNFLCQSNGGSGVVANNMKTGSFIQSACIGNTGDGYNCTNMESMTLKVFASSNGGQGIEFVSGCNGNFINDSIVGSNTSDGIKLTATSDNNTIGASVNITSNGGYGINIAASTCDNNTILSPLFLTNTSGTYSDSGTGTIIIERSSTQTIFGDGSDGNVTISVNTTLTGDKYYNNLTIDSGKTLTTGGYRIFVKGILTVNGIIERNGVNGDNGAGASGGAGGAALADGYLKGSAAGSTGGNGANGAAANGSNSGNGTNISNALGSAGVTGGSGASDGKGHSGGSPGTAGTATAAIAAIAVNNSLGLINLLDIPATGTVVKYTDNANSTGGGGGAGNGESGSVLGGGGGGAGSAAAILAIYAKSIVISATGSITANGGNGGNGANAAAFGNAGGGGGGGGGDGGYILLVYGSYSNSGTVTASAGTFGTGGTGQGSGSTGSSGNAGTAGTIKLIPIF